MTGIDHQCLLQASKCGIIIMNLLHINKIHKKCLIPVNSLVGCWFYSFLPNLTEKNSKVPNCCQKPLNYLLSLDNIQRKPLYGIHTTFEGSSISRFLYKVWENDKLGLHEIVLVRLIFSVCMWVEGGGGVNKKVCAEVIFVVVCRRIIQNNDTVIFSM